MLNVTARRAVEIRVVSRNDGRIIGVERKPVQDTLLETVLGKPGVVVGCLVDMLTEGTHFTENPPSDKPVSLMFMHEERPVQTRYGVRAVGEQYELVRYDQ